MTFGNKLSSLRKQANLTQNELAEKLSVSRQAVTKWEKGVGLPDINNLKKIASIFSVKLDDLLDYKVETIKLELETTKEKIDNKNVKLNNVDDYILEKFKNYDLIYKLYGELKLGFWRGLFYTIFDIDVAVMVNDLVINGLTYAYLVERNNTQYLVLVNKDSLVTKKLNEPFDKNKKVIDGYIYYKYEKNKLK